MPNSSLLKCALVQMTSTNDWNENLDHALKSIELLAGQGAQLIVFPENFLCFGQNRIDTVAPHIEACLAELQKSADALKCWLLCGSVPVAGNDDDPRFFSRSHLLKPDGPSAHYDKIHLFDVDVGDEVGAYRESDSYRPGFHPRIAEVEGRKLGLSICYDLRFPELYQAYMREGVEMVSIPSAFTYATGKQHWEILLRARAIETQSFVLAANQCGDHGKGRKTWGHSMVIAPDGQVIASCSEEPGTCIAELDFSVLEQIRSAMPLMNHKRLV